MTTAADIDAGIVRLTEAGCAALPANAREKLDAYIALLAKWNATYNLTAIREPERNGHASHPRRARGAAAFARHVSRPGLRLLDVGSGGGVPAIPFAIARPQWHIVALDSSHKKGAVPAAGDQRAAACRTPRQSSRGSKDYVPSAPFDIVISRAFSDLATFVATSARHLAADGVLVAMKGVFPDEEIAEPSADRARRRHSRARRSRVSTAERHLIVMARA
jgi:16S rRNA (guanine527-N7)-methyltransferase